MTTLVALATKDALVLGCDSLGTQTKYLLDPLDLLGPYFEQASDYALKIGPDGAPVLKNFANIYSRAQQVPFHQITHVTKLFDLSPLKMGVMITGIVSIKQRTISGLIEEFKLKDPAFRTKGRNYTVKSIAERLLKFIGAHYDDAFRESMSKPELELMVGGYDYQKHLPNLCRIFVHKKEIKPCMDAGSVGIAFGGQMKEIQRIVFGTDFQNIIKITERANILLDKYQSLLQQHIRGAGSNIVLPNRSTFNDALGFFDQGWKLDGLELNSGDYSDQNAIECVNFFVEVMIRSQEFGSSLPTVGGDVHIALITKRDGFRYISREEYEHRGYKTTKTQRKTQ